MAGKQPNGLKVCMNQFWLMNKLKERKIKMSLFKCPDCGNSISTSASSCPYCGKPFREEEDEKKGLNGRIKVLLAIVGIILMIIGFTMLFNGGFNIGYKS